MSENKYIYIPLIGVPLLFFLLISLIWRFGGKEKEKNDAMLKNDIVFSGEITKLSVSGNHAFGIIQLKITSKSIDTFQPFYDTDKFFPYSIKDSIAEIYNHIPLSIKKGYKVVLNSSNRTISFFKENKRLYEWEIFMITQEDDIKFIKENTNMNMVPE